jgi:TRAP-type C4-dicarboxylate transport system permease small subunit
MVARQVSYGIMLAFFGVLMVQGWKLTVRSMLQNSPSTGLPVGYVAFSIPLCAAISMLYIVEHMVRDARQARETGK